MGELGPGGDRLGDVLVYAVVEDSLSPESPLGDSLDVFVRREDAERFIEEIRGDEPELAKPLRIEKRARARGERAELDDRAGLLTSSPCGGLTCPECHRRRSGATGPQPVAPYRAS